MEIKVTTTYDPRGSAPARTDAREYDLRRGVTVIGSGEDADLRLPGLAEHHAEVRRQDDDEYVWVDLGVPAGSRVDGQPMGAQELHTGDRIEIGPWTLTFFREEFADHGRPYGGRQGGELAGHPTRA
jgi:hypothetical protein